MRSRPRPSNPDANSGADGGIDLGHVPCARRRSVTPRAFDINLGLAPAWGNGAIPGIYDPDEGAFRFTCGGEGKLAYDDPLMFPNQPGVAPAPTVGQSAVRREPYARQAGGERRHQLQLWRILAQSLELLDARVENDQGQVIHPDLVAVYYKRKRSVSKCCTPSTVTMGIRVGLPNQIWSIFGWDAGHPRPGARRKLVPHDRRRKHYANLDDLQLGLRGGRHIADHRQHARPGLLGWRTPRCRRSPQPHGLRRYGDWGYY